MQTDRPADGDRRDSEPQTESVDGLTDEAEQYNGTALAGERLRNANTVFFYAFCGFTHRIIVADLKWVIGEGMEIRQ